MKVFIKNIFRLLIAIAVIVGVIVAVDMFGLLLFQFYRGGLDIMALIGSLPLIFIIEGVFIVLGGFLLFLGFGEYRAIREGVINPVIAREPMRGFEERRVSQREFAMVMVVVGFILFFTGFFLI